MSRSVKQTTLLALVNETKQTDSDRAEESRSQQSGRQSKQYFRPKILLVEDNKDNQLLATKILQCGGYDVNIAENGIEAVSAVQQYIYNLILMDIYMPEMNGFDAAQAIRKFEKEHQLERVPIIAFTAHAIEGYREKCLNMDMDDFITKPVRKKQLLEAVSNWLDTRPN